MRKGRLFIFALSLLCGCLPDGVSDYSRAARDAARLRIVLCAPEGYSDLPFEEIDIKIQNKDRPFSYSVSPDSDGTADIRLQPGKYDVLASARIRSRHISVAGSEPDFLLSNEGIIGADGSASPAEVRINLNVSVPEELIFREIYYHGCSTPEGANYTKDTYLELYNNTGPEGKTIYLDSLCIAALYPANSTTGGNAWAGRDTIPIFQMFWMFPGDGQTYALAPGESAVVAAIAAVDHGGRCTSALNLSKAHFGCYDENLPKHEIAAGVTPMVMYMTGQGTAWALSIHSPAVVLFRPSMGVSAYMKDSSWERYAPGEHSGTRYRHIAAGWILDGVDCADSPSASIKRLPASVDASYVWMRSSHYSGKCISRKLDSEEGGIACYLDTNNSAEDFLPDQTPSPRLRND